MDKNELAAIRRARGLSQMELAARTGIHPATISRLEHSRIFPYRSWRQRLAMALKCKGEDIFGPINDEPTSR